MKEGIKMSEKTNYNYNGCAIACDILDCKTFEMLAEEKGVKILSKEKLEKRVYVMFGEVEKYEYVSTNSNKRCVCYEVTLYATNEDYGCAIYTCENDFDFYSFYEEIIIPEE